MAIDAELRAGAIDAETARAPPRRPRARVAALRRDGRRDAVRQGRRDRRDRDRRHQPDRRPRDRHRPARPVRRRGRRRPTRCSRSATGLVAQIPSLLVAVASGLLVTRVASTGDRALGEDLGAQLGGQPRVLGGAAILLVGARPRARPAARAVPRCSALLAAAARACSPRARGRAGRAALDEPGADGVRGPRLALRLSPRCTPARGAPGELHARARRASAPTLAARDRRPAPAARDRARRRRSATPRPRSRSTARRSRGSTADDVADGSRAAARRARAARARAARRRSRRRARRARGRDRAGARARGRAAHRLAARARRGAARPRARAASRSTTSPAILEAIALAPAPPGGFTAQTCPRSSSTCAVSCAARSARAGRRAASSRSTPSTR